MSAFLRNTDISVNMELFDKLFKYFLLDQECFPEEKEYGELPNITCHVYLMNTYIRLFSSEEFLYTLSGDITYSWIRNRMTHPEKIVANPKIVGQGI